MSETKFGHFILEEPFGKSVHSEIIQPIISIGRKEPVKQWEGFPFNMTMEAITTPVSMGGHGHTHDYDEILMFFGADPMNYQDFQAEAYIMLGPDNEEKEKHIINKTSFIWIPKGLMHCPLVFTRIDSPVVFAFIEFTEIYKANKKPEDLIKQM